MHWITLVLFIVGKAVAEDVYVGSCPNVKAVENFNVTAFMGKWYEASRYPTSFEPFAKCVTVDYALAKDGSVRIKNTQLSWKTGNKTIIRGMARPIGKSNSGKFAVKYLSLPDVHEATYWVLGTNYDDWGVVLACRGDKLLSEQHSWIYTRVANPSTEVINDAYKVLKENKILTGYFSETDQENCPKSN